MADDAGQKLLTTILVPVATYFGGLFTEPVKRWLLLRGDRKRLRNALYGEIVANFFALPPNIVYLMDDRLKDMTQKGGWLRTDAFVEAMKQPTLFYDLKEYKYIIDVYAFINSLQQVPLEEQRHRLRNANDAIVDAVRNKRLSLRLVRKYCRGQNREFLHPVARAILRLYETTTTRNLPPGYPSYLPARTLLGKMKAIWRGIPGDPQFIDILPFPPPEANEPQTPVRPPD
jgi:hypothetical protein